VKPLVLSAVVAVALLLTACQNKTAKPEATAEKPAASLDQMSTPPGQEPLMTDDAAYSPPPTAAKPLPPAGGKQPGGRDEVLTPEGGGRTYVVQKGDTLYGLSRKFYNDPSKWKKIWEANKTRIPNKDKLPVGTKLIIP